MATQSVESQDIRSPEKSEETQQPPGIYACPTCKRDVELGPGGLYCRVCAVTYPILDGIPDFIVVNLEESRNRTLSVVGKKDSRPLLDFMASVYETWVYPAVCNLFWSRMAVERTRPEPGCSTARNCSSSTGRSSSLPGFRRVVMSCAHISKSPVR